MKVSGNLEAVSLSFAILSFVVEAVEEMSTVRFATSSSKSAGGVDQPNSTFIGMVGYTLESENGSATTGG